MKPISHGQMTSSNPGPIDDSSFKKMRCQWCRAKWAYKYNQYCLCCSFVNRFSLSVCPHFDPKEVGKRSGEQGNKALSDCQNIASGVELSKALQCVLWYRVASVSRLFSLSVPPLSPSPSLSSFSLALLPQLVSLSLPPPIN